MKTVSKPTGSTWHMVLCIAIGLFVGLGVGYSVMWMRYHETGVMATQFALFLIQGGLCGLAVGIAAGLPSRDGKAWLTLGVLAFVILVTELWNALLIR